jgi:RNA polymerase sigma factor (sigma-70 family)
LESIIDYSDEAQLISAIRSGDQESFRFLVEKYQDNIIRTSKGFVHSRDDAEDIAQEVFIEVFKSVNKFRGESELSTWIYRIAVNKSLNFLKSASRRKFLSFFDYTDSENIALRNDPVASSDYYADEELNKSEQSEEVMKAIDRLPAKQRTAFILNKYDDLTYQEIANVMHTTVSAVESLLFRAKKSLQKKLYAFYKKNM